MQRDNTGQREIETERDRDRAEIDAEGQHRTAIYVGYIQM